MPDIVIMPKLGFDMAEGTLIRWVKNEGDSVEKGELLAEIETDKATVEVESLFTGTVRKHLVSQGAVVPVNTPIAVVGEADEAIDVDALLGTHQAPGDTTAEETRATTPSVGAQPAAPAAAAPKPSPAPQSPVDAPATRLKASPLARRIARDQGISLAAVAGSGPDGRIVKRDVEARLSAPGSAGVAASPPPIGAADLGSIPADELVPLSRLRSAIGRRMVQSKLDLPHFYVTRTYDVAPLLEVRRQVNAALAGSREKISVNDFIVKAAALALRTFPNLNASLDGENIIRHGHVNIGVAVAVENGLLTVVCPDADRKHLRTISAEIIEKASRVRAGKVHPDDITGSTFSVSNLGMFDVTHFTAIINPPEAAILAVGAAQQVPVVENDLVVPGWRMNATLSIDHRVSDGAEAAQFMQSLGRFIENPAGLLL